MSELAQYLIAKCKRTQSKFLDLGNCGLTEWPEELFECVWLEELNMGMRYWPDQSGKLQRSNNRGETNKFKEVPEEIGKLVHLQKLGLGYVGLRELDPKIIKLLTNIVTLYLGSNQISDISILGSLTSLQHLVLSSNQISDISILGSLTSLQHLVLSVNQISDISILGSLTSLQHLVLSVNQISDVSILGSLTGLQSLYLSDNDISHISILGSLTSLQHLDLRANQISDISILGSLTGLQSLYLSYNYISDISILGSLTGLQSLDLSDNPVRDISILGSLTGLQSLDMSSTKISDISILVRLTGLQSLNLSSNEISDISILGGLTGLQSLDLSNNDITDISVLEKLKFLKYLNLNRNKVTDISPIKHLIEQDVAVHFEKYTWATGICLNDNPLNPPPIEIIKEGNEAILSYLQQFETQQQVSIYEAKMLIVGEPGAGKTTLLNKLKDENYQVPNEQEESTVGINVHEGWPFPYANDPTIQFKANLWDFGGQEIQYMLHQFFLTPRSLYVLLADNRKQNTNFPYWFRIIHLLGKGEDQTHSPVLVVLNENKHQSITNFDMHLFQKEYKELEIRQLDVDFSKNDDRYFSLVKRIQQMLSDLPHIGKAQLPANWVQIRQELQAREESYISLEEYARICQKHHIAKEKDQLVLSRFLHDLGILLHFQQEEEGLHNLLVLKPKWAIDAIYSVLNNTKVAENKGRFTKQFVTDIWKAKDYSLSERGYLLALMRQDIFEICFPTKQKGEYITPLLLPTQAARYHWGYEHALRFRYQYAFMPPGILTRLIVRQSEYIMTHQGEEMVWKEGVYLKKDGCQIQIIERETREEGSKVIDISVIGGDNYERKYVLRSIRREIDEIHRKSFPSLQPLEKVPCICSECVERIAHGKGPYYHDFDVLLNFQRKKRLQRTCDQSADDVYIHALLEGVYDNDEWQRKEVSRMRH